MISTYFLNAYDPKTYRPENGQALSLDEPVLRECLGLTTGQQPEGCSRLTPEQARQLRRHGLAIDLRAHSYYVESQCVLTEEWRQANEVQPA